MADFDEDYEEPFYQEVPEETMLTRYIRTMNKKYGKKKEENLCLIRF